MKAFQVCFSRQRFLDAKTDPLCCLLELYSLVLHKYGTTQKLKIRFMVFFCLCASFSINNAIIKQNPQNIYILLRNAHCENLHDYQSADSDNFPS